METRLGRIPLVMVEIDQDFCTRTYGSSPCTAAIGTTGNQRCYNTFATCQDTANYDKGTLTLRFCEPTAQAPTDTYTIPSLVSASLTASKVNIAQNDSNLGPLGTRSKATVTFADHIDADRRVDPYADTRTYDPLSRGTFWSKWLARNPYHAGRPLRVIEGYVGQSVTAMQTRHYLIEKVTGPDSGGRVQIVAKDPLKLADGDRAKAPRRSPGLLSAAINNSQVTLTVASASLTDYPATGTLRINDEVMTYTGRSESGGIITFTGLTRGTDGTTADAHDEDDTVQLCLRYTSEYPWDVAYDLLVNYAGVSSSFIDYSAWNTEGLEYLSAYIVTTLITEPEDVDKLVGEIGRDSLSYYWWDDRNQLIQLTAIKPAQTPGYYLDEADHIVAGSFALTNDPDQRVNQVWVSYLPRTPVGDLDKPSTYRTTYVRIDADAAGPNRYNDTRIREIKSRWIATNAHAVQVASIIGQRYKDAPETVRLRLDAKDRAIGIGSIVAVKSRHIVDITGQAVYRRYEVISAKEIDAGHLVEIEAVSFQYIGRTGGWMETTANDYASATALELETGFYWSFDNGLMPDGNEGYNWQ